MSVVLTALVVAGAVGGAIAWRIRCRLNDEGREGPADWAAHYESVQKDRQARVFDASARRRAFFDELAADWPHRVGCRANGATGDLLVSKRVEHIKWVPGRPGTDHFSTAGTWDLAVSDIFEVRLERTTEVKIVKRTETVVTPTKNQKSPVGRAVVGGLILGPIGAVAGAASGLKSPDPTVTTREVEDKVEVDGIPALVVTTRDMARPLVRLQFSRTSMAEQWLARLQGAISR